MEWEAERSGKKRRKHEGIVRLASSLKNGYSRKKNIKRAPQTYWGGRVYQRGAQRRRLGHMRMGAAAGRRAVYTRRI